VVSVVFIDAGRDVKERLQKVKVTGRISACNKNPMPECYAIANSMPSYPNRCAQRASILMPKGMHKLGYTRQGPVATNNSGSYPNYVHQDQSVQPARRSSSF